MKRERNERGRVTIKEAMCRALLSVVLCIAAVCMMPQSLGTMPYVEARQEETTSGNSTSPSKPSNSKDSNDDKS